MQPLMQTRGQIGFGLAQVCWQWPLHSDHTSFLPHDPGPPVVWLKTAAVEIAKMKNKVTKVRDMVTLYAPGAIYSLHEHSLNRYMSAS